MNLTREQRWARKPCVAFPCDLLHWTCHGTASRAGEVYRRCRINNHEGSVASQCHLLLPIQSGCLILDNNTSITSFLVQFIVPSNYMTKNTSKRKLVRHEFHHIKSHAIQSSGQNWIKLFLIAYYALIFHTGRRRDLIAFGWQGR